MIIYAHKKKRGRGLVNNLLNRLPFELHIPGYQYCGPGTKLAKRLARGDPGINPLDSACKEHDIAYSRNRENIQARNEADKILAEKAWNRVKSKDAGFGEKAAAYAVTNTMKLKSRFGMGLKRKKKATLSSVIRAARKSTIKSKCSKSVIGTTLDKARDEIKKVGGKDNIQIPRVLPIPKTGGILPLIPLFAGLSAVGALAGGAAGIAKAVNDSKAAKQQLEENKRHNKTIESIAMGKGLYLKPYKQGFGLYLKPWKGEGLTKKKLLGSNFT